MNVPLVKRQDAHQLRFSGCRRYKNCLPPFPLFLSFLLLRALYLFHLLPAHLLGLHPCCPVCLSLLDSHTSKRPICALTLAPSSGFHTQHAFPHFPHPELRRAPRSQSVPCTHPGAHTETACQSQGDGDHRHSSSLSRWRNRIREGGVWARVTQEAAPGCD